MQKTISEMAQFIKELIPTGTLEEYTLKPKLESVACEETIRNGVLAFREFLYKLYDCLIADGGLYENPPKKLKNDDSSHDVSSLAVGWPFINNATSILINIGYNGELTENDDSMMLIKWQLTSVIDPQGGSVKQNISGPKVVESLRFLASCGLNFSGIDLDVKKPDLTKINLLRISYPDNPAMLTGLKVMAIAHNELSSKNDYYVFQRCDYRILRNESPDVTALLKDYISPLPAKVQDFVLKLHQRYLDAGLICKMKMHYFNVIFSYSYKSNVIWDFMPSPNGCCIFTKAKNMDKYSDDIGKFSLSLQNKIAKGYGCEKKRFGEPCQKGCHGFRFSLDDSVLDINRDIEIWLDKEVSCLRR